MLFGVAKRGGWEGLGACVAACDGVEGFRVGVPGESGGTALTFEGQVVVHSLFQSSLIVGFDGVEFIGQRWEHGCGFVECAEETGVHDVFGDDGWTGRREGNGDGVVHETDEDLVDTSFDLSDAGFPERTFLWAGLEAEFIKGFDDVIGRGKVGGPQARSIVVGIVYTVEDHAPNLVRIHSGEILPKDGAIALSQWVRRSSITSRNTDENSRNPSITSYPGPTAP